jgi:putative transposase
MLHRRLPRLDLPHQVYYLTCCLERRRRLLAKPELAGALLRLYAAEQDRGAIALHAYVVMPDHYHVILTLRACPSISSVVRRVQSLFAPEGRRVSGIPGRIWQRRFYDHVIRDTVDLRAKLVYIHRNPVRAELVDDPTLYEWSSCRFWETGSGPIECDEW